MSTFEDIVEEIEEINLLDPATIAERLNKVTEELGEVATEVNKLTGRKVRKKGEDDEDVRNNIEEELADLIQCAISLGAEAGVDCFYLLDKIEAKNDKWRNVIVKKKRAKKLRSKKRVISKFDRAIKTYNLGNKEEGIRMYISISPSETRHDAINYLDNVS